MTSPGDRPADEVLVEQIQVAPEGDLRAMETLIERHQDRIVANCRFLTGRDAEAEDLAQEVFVKAFFGLSRFEHRSRFKTWLQRIKINHCLNFLKKAESKIFIDVDEVSVASRPEMHVQPEAEHTIEYQAHRLLIQQVLDSMSDTLRVPLILRDADGLSYQEIAEALGIGLSAVKMRIKRAREEFRALFQAGGPKDRTSGADA